MKGAEIRSNGGFAGGIGSLAGGRHLHMHSTESVQVYHSENES